MMKMEIRLDENSIRKDGEYSFESISEALDNCFMQYKFKKEIIDDNSVMYWGKGDSEDFGIFGAIILTLKDTEWFMKYVDRWYWYSNSCMPYEDWFRQEDLLEQMGLGASA